MPDNPYAVWERIRLALHDWTGGTWYNGDLEYEFVERLNALCALSMVELTDRQARIVGYWCYDFTPQQIMELTGQETVEAHDRHLTISEIQHVTHWSERAISRELTASRRILHKILRDRPPRN